MKRKLLAACAAAIFAFAIAAPATPGPNLSNPPVLEAVASVIAGGQRVVNCYEPKEAEDSNHVDPYDFYGAWGLVYPDIRNEVHLAKEVCDGAVAVSEHDESVPAWQRAVGVWVLTHEALHTKNWKHWEDEDWTECYAIKQFKRAAAALGASPEEVDELYPIAAAFHFRQGVVYPQYNLKSCKVPWFYGPDGPRG